MLVKEDPHDYRSFSNVDMDRMSGEEFEQFCCSLLKASNYRNVRLTSGSGDQGVDILAEKGGIKYAIQCKRYSSPLGNTPIQEVHAGKDIYGCHVGVVMTNQYFTEGAKEAASKTNTILWNRDVVNQFIEVWNNSKK